MDLDIREKCSCGGRYILLERTSDKWLHKLVKADRIIVKYCENCRDFIVKKESKDGNTESTFTYKSEVKISKSWG